MLFGKNMKRSELRILLEWFYDDKYRDLRGETWLRSEGWRPDEDSDQLELLKQKFLKEANITRIEYNKTNSGWWEAVFNIGVSYDVINSKGEDIKDCDSDAILQYINRSKNGKLK